MSMNSGAGGQTTRVYRDGYTNIRAGYSYSNPSDSNTTGNEGPPAQAFQAYVDISGFPDYLDANGDGYPEKPRS